VIKQAQFTLDQILYKYFYKKGRTNTLQTKTFFFLFFFKNLTEAAKSLQPTANYANKVLLTPSKTETDHGTQTHIH
jgi:hypothetical protein